MLFNSLPFFIFFPTVTALYFVFPHRFRWIVLLTASAIFYMAFIPAYLLILLFTIVIDYIAGLLIENATGKRRLLYLIISLVSNIGILTFFKYFNFFSASLTSIAHLIHWNYSFHLLSIILPVGLSFHTFQALSYTIEVYRGQQKAERHLGIYALYVMFFPQLVAGPIERPQNLIHQFKIHHSFDWQRVGSGLRLMLWGFFKKIVIADNAAAIINRIFDYPTQFTGLPLIIAAILFTFQLYCDFSGYSDIAIGSARVLGFRLMKNFDQPFGSRTLPEFWRKWHISLSTWFRDYLYIPLGGNRVPPLRHYLNLLIIFTISGLWHGANWTYVIWGCLHGFFMIFSTATVRIRQKLIQLFKLERFPRFHHILQMCTTFSLVVTAFIFFRANTTSDAWHIITHLFADFNFTFSKLLNALGTSSFNFIHLLTAIACMEIITWAARQSRLKSAFISTPLWMKISGYTTIVLWIIFFGYFGERPFIYFQF